ncbi:hypothetical protein TREMEDRAFT_58834 [Tremella mesenterica DSM 1558]|uniref:uncharacterized protein n=1 Tax=Tremella mesenterica (strain ATCC 24925 / CBS 8224 / DSM 1558 / NBRC 9311 / NRRL Y-6157 / RJB 2259-6 / UBC 559-6) TaxID=578456 RepID=UPI0003F49A88|nr:uncharacterized protein TREMEDRAFT_58834 [Tremella mesenterica DSM 1558]EIW72665.1 hypothetical protein TREMEDRAFT_58834 [Tremella mesenterica DSM 1558]
MTRNRNKAYRKVWDVGLRSHTIASRGAGFHQWWFGVWCRYAKHSVVSADSRQKGSQSEVLELLKAFDGIFGDKPRTMLHRLDKKVAISMAHNHWRVHNYLKDLKEKFKTTSTPTPSSFRKTAESLDSTHSQATAVRLGGMGMMLAVSWGEGTEWHVDAKDYGNHYTIISVLTSPALLHLPELGCTILIHPGDVVGFLAHRYLHKLEPVPLDTSAGSVAAGTSVVGTTESAESAGSGGSVAVGTSTVGAASNGGDIGGERSVEVTPRRQVVFTCWTDKNTQARMAEYRHFHQVVFEDME